MCAHSLHASDFTAVFTWITVAFWTWGGRRTFSPFDMLTSEPAGWHFQCTPQHGPTDDSEENEWWRRGKSWGNNRGSLVSPSSLLIPACTTVFLQHGIVNVLFAGLHCYQPAKVCEEASQTYRVFVLHFPHCAPSNRSLLPLWKLLLILITLLLGTLQFQVTQQ